MHHHFNALQAMLLLGGSVLVLVAPIVGFYFLKKSLGQTLKSDPVAEKVRVDNQAAFTLAAMQGVLTQLKSEQKATQEKLTAAERRAEETARKFDLLAREIDFGLMIFDAQGFITFSNPLARKILAVDAWSRRRFVEIFVDTPTLVELIGACFEAGTEVRREPVKVQGLNESKGTVEVSVLLTRDRAGALETVACVFRELAPPPANLLP